MIADETLKPLMNWLTDQDFKYSSLAILISYRERLYEQFLSEVHPDSTYTCNCYQESKQRWQLYTLKGKELQDNPNHPAFAVAVHSWLCDKLKSIDNDVTT